MLCLVVLTSKVLLCINLLLAFELLPVLLKFVLVVCVLISCGLARSKQLC
jgi:hypothetical protein